MEFLVYISWDFILKVRLPYYFQMYDNIDQTWPGVPSMENFFVNPAIGNLISFLVYFICNSSWWDFYEWGKRRKLKIVRFPYSPL